MIEHRNGGSLFNETVEALVNPVNCVGVMGRGLALDFKHKFPDNFLFYSESCDRGEVRVGEMLTFSTGGLWPEWIINFPTKQHWRQDSTLEHIRLGLEGLRATILSGAIRSIAVPALGCGLGGLDWDDVRPLILGAFEDFDHMRVVLFGPC